MLHWHQLREITGTILSIKDCNLPRHLQSASVQQWTAAAEIAGAVLTLPADPDMLRFNLIHRRLGHAGFQTIHNMVVGGMVEGLKLTPRQLKSMPSYRLHAADCVCCKLAKMHASPHKTSQHQVSRPLQEVHMDVAGPHVDLGRCKEAYYLMLVDVYSNAVWVACFKTRHQVP